MSKNLEEKSAVAQREEEILKFWKENKIFEKSLEKPHHGEITFYDGPPFATGLPHYGHILAGTIKDVIPRFETMRGKRVLRRWGWDCHGLPIENLIEGELGLKNRKDIEDYGIEKFNEAARSSVFRYDKEWREIVPRSGRWVDMDDQYITMSPSYMESVWWSFAELHKKGLVYEGFKSMHLCPHCETTLANFEVAQGYKDITDISVTVKFELVDEPGTYLLAWTTTPWTLPGNVALAINENLIYCKVKSQKLKVESVDYEIYVLSKGRIKNVFKDGEYEVLEEFKGSDLVGMSYKPLFDYYAKEDFENKENAWKVYAADFVSTEEGTGIVHIAPAFGQDDLNLSQKEKLPVIQHVGRDGKFVKEVTDFAGMDVKPKSDGSTGSPQTHQKADIEIIKFLAHKNLLFSKEKINHSYPHCWRCDTPLLNYAASSWFVEVTKYKDKFIRENKKVSWVPKEIGEGRFGNWLEGARDWAISRSRFWGATLPIWKCEGCEKKEVIGSIEDLKKKVGKRNRYIIMRHGEAESNAQNFINDNNSTPAHLTEKGKGQAKRAAEKLKREKIDVIISSPIFRTKETADIVASFVGKEVIVDERLKEVQTGVFNGKPVSEYQKFANVLEKFEKRPLGGENLADIKKRTGDFIYEIDKRYEGKNILVVTHDYVAWMLYSAAQGFTSRKAASLVKDEKSHFIGTAEIKKLPFVRIPHNRNYEVDLHRPYIDEVTFSCECGKEMKRIPDVFDTWYESGSMPYASHHYPFEKSLFNPRIGKRFPADFIAEGVDQTRGWFYSLLMLSTALFGRSPYKNVIVNGTVLAEDGQKMAKRLKNYPEVGYILNKYGADAIRYYMVSSPVVRAEDFAFSEKGVDEVVKKIILRLSNVCSFYEMYEKGEPASPKSPHILDRWILSRLSEVIEKTTKGLHQYELDVASRPFLDFVDDLSVWYLRRSRERFKREDEKDKRNATMTTRFVLKEFAKILAPFMPFIAEDIYSRVKEGEDKESVHLETWPKAQRANKEIISQMATTRKVVSLALEARASAGIKVRQPLSSLSVKDMTLKEKNEYISLIKDEVNVKEIVFQASLEKEVELDIEMTPELKEEGIIRDFMRVLQDDRKEKGLTPKDTVALKISSSEKDFILKWEDELKRVVGISSIDFQDSNLVSSFESSDKSFSYALVV